MPKPHPYLDLSSDQKQSLIGSLLGDAHINNPKYGNSAFRICRASKDRDYLLYEADLWKNVLPHAFSTCLVKDYEVFDHRTQKINYGCVFWTQSNPVFTEYRHKWYIGRTKIVPSDLELTAMTMAHWMADDAYIRQSTPIYRFRMTFATDGFTKQEVEFLAHLLHLRYKEEFFVSRKINHFIILAQDSACRAVFADVDPFFKMTRKRLWDAPETRFWTDIPERQASYRISRGAKMYSIYDYLSDKDSFTLNELGRAIGHFVSKTDVRKNEVDTRSLRKTYLDPLVAEGLIVENKPHPRNTIPFKITDKGKEVFRTKISCEQNQ